MAASAGRGNDFAPRHGGTSRIRITIWKFRKEERRIATPTGTVRPNEDRVTPSVAAAFILVILAGTDAGDEYTFAQYEKMLGSAGFVKTRLHPVLEMPEQVLDSEK